MAWQKCPFRGAINSDSSVFYFGERINLTCTLDPGNENQLLSESKLFFLSSKLKEGQDDRILNGYPLVDSPRLGIAIVDRVNQTASKENKYMHYMCMYNQDLEEKDWCYVAHFFVEIDYKPLPPKSGSCVTYNWERIECYWDLSVEYRQLHGITNASVDYSLTTEKWTSCPSLKVSGRNLTCIIDEGKNSVLFMGQYYFHLVVNNTKTLDSVSSMKQIMSTDIVKPAKVYSVFAMANKTSIHLKWSVEKINWPQLFRIRYTVTPVRDQNPDWQEVNTTDTNAVLRDLKPFTEYTIWISAIPLVRNQSKGFWSDIKSIVNKTEQDVPGDVPRLDPGFYACVNTNCTAVRIFWKQIGEESKNGIITRFRITSQVNDTHSPPQFIENPSTTSHLVPVNNKYSTKILLNVATEVGFSTKSDSSLIVPPLGQGPPFPRNIIVEALQAKFINISWTSPSIHSGTKTYFITNYSVVWCIGDHTGCKGEIDSEIVPVKKGKDHYWTNLTLPDSFEMFAFGISVDAYMKKTGRFISSGIRWNQCAYAVDAVPEEPVNINPVIEDPGVSNNSMLFTWTRYTCQKHGVGSVLNFTVKVCTIDDETKTCQGPPRVEVLNGNETSYRVTNLESGKNYKITVTAEFNGGSSPPAKYQFRSFSVSTLDHEANRGTEGGVPLGVIIGTLVAVFAVAGFIFIAWRIRRCLRTPEMEIELPTVKPGEKSISNHTENVPLLSSGNHTPSKVQNGGVKSVNMLENPYYLSSHDYSGHEHTEYSYIPNDSGLHSETVDFNNSHTAPSSAPNGSAVGADGTSDDETPYPQSRHATSANFTSAEFTSADLDSYSKAVEPQNDHSAAALSCENISAYVSGSAGLCNNDSSAPTGVNEFGYCPNV